MRLTRRNGPVRRLMGAGLASHFIYQGYWHGGWRGHAAGTTTTKPPRLADHPATINNIIAELIVHFGLTKIGHVNVFSPK